MLAKTLSRLLARQSPFLAVLRAAVSAVILTAPSFAIEAVSETEAAESAIKIKIEAESYTRTHSQGGQTIRLASCAEGSSGGAAVDGLDWPGDWILLEVTVPEAIVFRDSLRSAGDVGLRRKYSIEFYPRGSWVAQLADTLITRPGSGIT